MSKKVVGMALRKPGSDFYAIITPILINLGIALLNEVLHVLKQHKVAIVAKDAPEVVQQHLK